MDTEEEHIREHIEEREKALKQKIKLLKDRIEQIKRMADVKALVSRRPALMVAGSVLTGFVLKKITLRRHGANDVHRVSPHYVRYENGVPEARRTRGSSKLKDALIAVLAGAASRTATNFLTDLTKQIIPGKYDVRRAERNFRSTRHNP